MPALRVIRGEGQRKDEPLTTRDAVCRALVESGCDLLLRHISAERAEEIEARVERIMTLFDRVDSRPGLKLELTEEIDALERLMRETRTKRRAR